MSDIHLLRNPAGHSQEALREAQLSAANRLEELERRDENDYARIADLTRIRAIRYLLRLLDIDQKDYREVCQRIANWESRLNPEENAESSHARNER